MSILAHLIHSAAGGAAYTGLAYAGTVSITALTAVAAPTAERRRDARAVLKLMLRARHSE